jgi:hypothetical protein
MAHLIDDKTVAKMGHPVVVGLFNMGSAVKKPDFGKRATDHTRGKLFRCHANPP